MAGKSVATKADVSTTPGTTPFPPAASEGAAGRPVTMSHLVRATRRELQKMGKSVVAGDLGPYARVMDE